MSLLLTVELASPIISAYMCTVYMCISLVLNGELAINQPCQLKLLEYVETFKLVYAQAMLTVWLVQLHGSFKTSDLILVQHSSDRYS